MARSILLPRPPPPAAGRWPLRLQARCRPSKTLRPLRRASRVRRTSDESSKPCNPEKNLYRRRPPAANASGRSSSTGRSSDRSYSFLWNRHDRCRDLACSTVGLAVQDTASPVSSTLASASVPGHLQNYGCYRSAVQLLHTCNGRHRYLLTRLRLSAALSEAQ